MEKSYYEGDKSSESDFKKAIKLGGNDKEITQAMLTNGKGSFSPNPPPENIKIQKVDGLNVFLNIRIQGNSKNEGWLQILPDGKIKYDPKIFLK